jgi:transposase
VQDVTATHEQTPEQRIAQLESELASAKGKLSTSQDKLSTSQDKLAAAEATITRVRRAYHHALEQLQLLRHRLFLAKAERTEVAAEQLAFDKLFEQVKKLEEELNAAEEKQESKGDDDRDNDEPKKKRKPGGQGRRNFDESTLPVVRVEITDPELEGKAERIGSEESSRLGYQRGFTCRIVLERITYKVVEPVNGDEAHARDASESEATSSSDVATEAAVDATPPPSRAPEVTASSAELGSATDAPPPRTRFVTAPLPKELVRRGLLAPSMIAHILASKYLLGVPFYRLEQQMALRGAPLDRGTMCRYAEDVGASLGFIVMAMRDEAFATAFCLSTDATGICIQPGPMKERKVPKPGPCRKGHFFVVLADRDHVFFEYQAKHTSAVVCEMFRGFSGYIQADAHAVYDALFRGTPPRGKPELQPSGPPPIEVGCWSHARTNFWEAATCKHELGAEGLRRIALIFAADGKLRDLPPAKRKAVRDAVVRPLVDAFFAWAKAQYARPRERGLVATALGYAINQESPLRRFLDDGRLRLENNPSERALRAIAMDVSLCTPFSSTRNHKRAAVLRIATRAAGALPAAA